MRKRLVLACSDGFSVSFIVVTAINYVLSCTVPSYHAAERTLDFTLEMKWVRLLVAIATSLVARAVTLWISPMGYLAPWVVGGVVLAIFQLEKFIRQIGNDAQLAWTVRSIPLFENPQHTRLKSVEVMECNRSITVLLP